VNFPVATRLQLVSDFTAYDIQIWVFTNISGLVLLDTDGNIESCNPHFVKILFGQSEMDLKGKSITALIPGFFDDLVFGSYDSSIDEETDDTASGSKESLDSSSCGSNERESNSGLHSLMNLLNTNDSIPQKSPRPQKFLAPMSYSPHHDKENRLSAANEEEIEEDIVANELKHLTSTPAGVKIKPNIHLRSKVKAEFPEGRFFGFGRHRDGAEINILYQIRRVSLEDKSFMYCLWIAKDPDDYSAASRLGTLTLESSNAETKDDSLGESIRRAVEKRNEMRILQLNHAKNGGLASQEGSGRSDSSFLLCKGSYNEKYCTLQQIGKGAFGCVKTAFRRSDRRMVVTKFIKRSKVFEENWVTDTVLGMRVPLEISLLSTLEHPNIVQVLDVHENEEYLQLVMQRHGAGMDLFEFLDRRPKMDEPLASYIFRQVVCAIEYLHKERGLLHRDIKDENVIINEHFHVKLIDFGSVAPIPKDGWLYSTFYGTVEYCSPEVLNGNCYAGRELEMWTLGILLYVMIFNENPFYGVDETLQCQLKPPFAITPLCMELIKKLLEKDPHFRMRLDQLASHEWVTQAVQIENYSFRDIVHCSDDELHPIQYYPETPSKSDDKLISSLISRETGVLEDSTMAASVEASANSLSDSLLHILD